MVAGNVYNKMRNQKNQHLGREEKHLIKKLNYRLSLQNIRQETDLIINMNKNLEISFSAVANIEQIRHLTKPDLIKLLKHVSCVSYHPATSKSKELIKLEYENASKLVLVTGIQREFVDRFLVSFNGSRRIGEMINMKPPFAKITNDNLFWICIQTVSDDAASALKKYLRNQKRNMDDKLQKNYKVEKRRTRIIIVQEDLFTLLIDFMTENKAEEFVANFKSIPPAVERRRSQENSMLPGNPQEFKKVSIFYRPLPMICNSSQNYQYRNEQREQQLSDGFSESTSLNSDLFDPKKMKDVIETSDQGIQSESNLPLGKEYASDAYFVDSAQSSPSVTSVSQDKAQEQIRDQQKYERKHEQQSVKQKQILKMEVEAYGVASQDQKILEKVRTLELKEQKRVFISEIISSKKIEELSHKDRTKEQEKSVKVSEGTCQTEEQLYTPISIALMRKCLQQFKNRGHNKLVQLPEWLKSETEYERNRHRFFSSLCRPRIIDRRRPF